MLLSWIFISFYTTIIFSYCTLFFQMFIFQWIRYLNVFMFFVWERGYQLSSRATVGGMGGHPKNLHLRTGGGEVTPYVYPRTYTITFYVFTSILSCFICRNLTLPLLKRDVFVTNGYFALTRSISFVMKYVFLT